MFHFEKGNELISLRSVAVDTRISFDRFGCGIRLLVSKLRRAFFMLNALHGVGLISVRRSAIPQVFITVGSSCFIMRYI